MQKARTETTVNALLREIALPTFFAALTAIGARVTIPLLFTAGPLFPASE